MLSYYFNSIFSPRGNLSCRFRGFAAPLENHCSRLRFRITEYWLAFRRWTGACECNAKIWPSGSAGQSGRHLISLARESDAVVADVFRLTRREQVRFALALRDSRCRIAFQRHGVAAVSPSKAMNKAGFGGRLTAPPQRPYQRRNAGDQGREADQNGIFQDNHCASFQIVNVLYLFYVGKWNLKFVLALSNGPAASQWVTEAGSCRSRPRRAPRKRLGCMIIVHSSAACLRPIPDAPTMAGAHLINAFQRHDGRHRNWPYVHVLRPALAADGF